MEKETTPPVLDYRSPPPMKPRKSEWRESPRGMVSIYAFIGVILSFLISALVPSGRSSSSLLFAVGVFVASLPYLGLFFGVVGLFRDRVKWAAIGGVLLNGIISLLGCLLWVSTSHAGG